MYALVDCNSFFCSVEKVFHPGLEGKPVCVLSNNDGCIVALTPEAKACGLHRGDPIFKVEGIVKHYDVKLFSTNMMLYASMSKRVTSILRKNIAHVENYSIDESFCDLRGYETHYDLTEMMRGVGEKIRLWTDIPVSIGVAPSKTLAKIGSKFAKKYAGYMGVCSIDTSAKRRKALELFDLADVWGIGRMTLSKLNYYGIQSPLEFADKSESWVKRHLTKPGVQTWMELNGIPCIDTHEVKRNLTVCTSRSFGNMVGDLASLKESVATFAASCANKLRGQQSGCQSVTVFIASNRFREDLEQYGTSATETLLVSTSDTVEITKAAMRALERIYREGIMYKRSGVIVSDVRPISPLEQDLFDPIQNRKERATLMHTIDELNHRFGLKTVRLCAEGGLLNAKRTGASTAFDAEDAPWKLRCEYKSPNYITDINELLTVGP